MIMQVLEDLLFITIMALHCYSTLLQLEGYGQTLIFTHKGITVHVRQNWNTVILSLTTTDTNTNHHIIGMQFELNKNQKNLTITIFESFSESLLMSFWAENPDENKIQFC